MWYSSATAATLAKKHWRSSGCNLKPKGKSISRLKGMDDGARFTQIRFWEWRSDAKAVVGGQEKAITPILENAHVAVFVFKTRIGAVTWEELTAFRDRIDNTCPVIALFPANAPSPEQMRDKDIVASWLDLLGKADQLTSDWTKPGSKSLVPVEAYRDREHLLDIVRDQLRRLLSGLLKKRSVTAAK